MSVSNFIVQNGIQFPDGTTQSTSLHKINPPSGLTGSLGDRIGQFSYDENYNYYCFQNFENNTTVDLSLYLVNGLTLIYAYYTEDQQLIENGWVVTHAFDSDMNVLEVTEGTTIDVLLISEMGSIFQLNQAIVGGTPSNVYVSSSESLPIIWKKSVLSEELGSQGPQGLIGPEGGPQGPQGLTGPPGVQGAGPSSTITLTDADDGITLSTPDSDLIIFVNVFGSVEVFLPDVSEMIGKKLTFIRIDGGGENYLRISGPFYSDQTSYSLYGFSYGSVTIVSNGTTWYKIAST